MYNKISLQARLHRLPVVTTKVLASNNTTISKHFLLCANPLLHS